MCSFIEKIVHSNGKGKNSSQKSYRTKDQKAESRETKLSHQSISILFSYLIRRQKCCVLQVLVGCHLLIDWPLVTYLLFYHSSFIGYLPSHHSIIFFLDAFELSTSFELSLTLRVTCDSFKTAAYYSFLHYLLLVYQWFLICHNA